MPSVTGTQSTHTCRPNDHTKPPTPQIARAIAFDKVDNLRVVRNTRTNTGWSRRPDPAYIELGNVEAGSKIEIINLSKNPEASFDSAKDKTDLTITGRDIRNRQAGVYLTNAQMEAIDLKAGDQFQLRVVDPQGNVSDVVAAELEPNDWANVQVQPFANNRWSGTATPGGQFSALDGESARKNLIVRAVADGRAPILMDKKLSLNTVSFSDAEKAAAQCMVDNKDALIALKADGLWSAELMQNLSCDTNAPAAVRDAAKKIATGDFFQRLDASVKEDGLVGFSDFEFAAAGKRSVELVAERAIEPHSRVEVFNTRTGKSSQANVGVDQKINVKLADVAEGDTLIVRPFDNEGVAGAELEMLYSASCKNGRAKTHDILGARLTGVI